MQRQTVTAAQVAMENDETTPGCPACGAEHVGVLTPCYLLARGNYVFSPELGCEVFVLAPDAGITSFSLPNGMVAFVVDVQKKGKATMIMHEECVDMALERYDDMEDPDEEDDYEWPSF